ncbi:hypothetical protein ARALYDRAFT_911032 [Arabidopsis lyrata subsp. lyrata]|uniref:Ubiquitin-like protease family profile domain-containing protein n=1 Tax=Arabidopsis lyrata subsp. lyrata TaxID=81972 RepID=D7M7N3_ARALL|nr:hypothetical protein ARALYDRAFT_911032 [Arabidopsis lyrata subsp. lyrata]
MLETMNGTISELDKNMRNRMDALESKFESLVTKRVSDVDVKEMKEYKPEFATSNNNEDDEATSKSPSWVVEENPTSHDGLPIQRVVKKVYTVRKKEKKEGEISGDLILFEKKDGTKPERKNYENAALKLEATKTVVKASSKPALAVAVTKVAKKGGSKAAVKEVAAKNPGFKASKIGGAKAAVQDEAATKDGSKAANKSATMAGNKMKMKSITQEDDVVDVTDQVKDDALKMVSSSEDTFSDPGQQHANKVMNATLTAMVEKIKNLDEGMTVGRRVPQLDGSQKYPYVGNSTVKRIITDGGPSSSIPDHLKPASDEKVHQLFDFLEEDEEFLLTLTGLIINVAYGSAMAMFRKRLMREPSVYPNQRITFLDQYMLRELAQDYKHFSGGRKCFKFRDFFAEHLNGTAPIESATHKKWFVDVDHLYACLFVNGDHWVALDIDLPMKRINIYDSIPHLTTIPEMSRQCMFLREMIPAMMSVMVPEEIRKKSTARLEVKRITKKVPVNKDPGDWDIIRWALR